MNGLVEDRDLAGHLENLERVRNEVRARHAADDAVGGRVVLGVVGDTRLEQRRGPWLEGYGLAGLHAGGDVFDQTTGRAPEAGNRGLSVGRARSRGIEISPAVGGAWNS